MRFDLRSVLNRRGMKPSELADVLDVSRGYISEVMANKKFPSREMLERIAGATGASPNELFGVPTVSASAVVMADEAVQIDLPTADPIERLRRIARHPQAYRATKTHLAFGILKGDVLIIDLGDNDASGSCSIVTRADLATGTATTMLRKLGRDIVYSDDPSDPPEAWSGPTHDYAVMGKIVALWREY